MITPTSFSGNLESSRSATGRERGASIKPETAYDAELVRRFSTGDDTAFAEIVTRHRGRMYAIAYSVLRNQADAEEIAQDTFVRAYRNLARFRGDCSLSSWLHRIALNLSRNRYWYFFQRSRHKTQSLDCALSVDNEGTFADLVASDTPGPVREAAMQELSAQVAECMEKLSARQREILMMRNHMNHSYEEIAVSLGISAGTVKSRIARARENLRKHLALSYGESESDPSPSFQWFESSRTTGYLVGSACG